MKQLFLILIPCVAIAGTEPMNVNTADGKVKQTSSGVGAIGKPFNFLDVHTSNLLLREHGDVNITSPTNAQVLTYDSGTSKWINANAGGGGSGTVTSITATSPIVVTPSPITTTGAISIADTAVTPGSYTNTNLTVDAKGRITAAANGSIGTGTVTDVTVEDNSGFTGGGIPSMTGVVTITPDNNLFELYDGGSGQAVIKLKTETDVSDTAYGVSWDGVTGVAPSKNAVYDKIESMGLTTGNLTDAGTDGIVVTGGTGAVVGSGTSLAQHVADSTHNGYLSSTDWTTFNGHSTVTPAALTKTDDTNVTLTLGGTPATALLQAASITAGWTGTLSQARGGFGKSTASTLDGQIPIGKTSDGSWNVNTITAGTGISVTNGAGTITLANTGITSSEVSDTAFASSWNGVTTIAPSKNAVYDEIHLFDTADNGTILNAGTGFRIGGAAASRKILVGDGTNFVASTETYAVPGTSGNVLTSDGTNWTSAVPAGATFANPTASVGASVVNGSATTAMRSDAAPPINKTVDLGMTAAQSITLSNASNSSVTDILTLDHEATSPADGVGAGLVFKLKDTTTSNLEAGRINVVWGVATHATRQSYMDFKLANANASDFAMRLYQEGAGNSGALSVGSTTDPGINGIINAHGGFWYASAASTSGKLLQSDGSAFRASTMTWPSGAAPTSRKIVVSNGTNMVASTETYAVPGTSGNVLTSDGTNWTSAAPASIGYQIYGGSSVALAPADAQTYFFGDGLGITITQHLTIANCQMTIPKAGTITRVQWHVLVVTNGSNENVSHLLRLNNTTDTSLSTTETYDPGANTTKNFSYTGLSIAVAAGDTIAFKVVCPTWATNPTFSSGELRVWVD